MMSRHQTAEPKQAVETSHSESAVCEPQGEFPIWLKGRLETIVDQWKVDRPPMPDMYLEFWGRSAKPGR